MFGLTFKAKKIAEGGPDMARYKMGGGGKNGVASRWVGRVEYEPSMGHNAVPRGFERGVVGFVDPSGASFSYNF